MRPGPDQTFVRDLDVLYHMGAVGGSTDRELLGHLTARDGAAAHRAFEAIVGRHGPMVLGVCRRALRDEHTAEDAFQATFLVLALKAGTIRMRDSLGPWLHGVAARICRRARVLADRRREQALASGAPARCVPEGSELEAAELRSALDEEIDRLPAAYRRAIVLCYLEGRTQEDAARELGWTKGTVSGRLARAKDLLRARLGRRGFAPSAGLVGAILAGEHARAAVPPSMSDAAVRTALGVALGRGEGIAASGSAVTMARGAIRAILLGKVGATGAALLLLATIAAALVHAGVGGSDPPAPAGRAGEGPTPQPRPAASAEVSRAAEPKLPEHARARLGTTRLRHQAFVSNVVFAPDGRTLASAGYDGPVRFWDVATGEPAAGLPAIREPGPWRGSIPQCLAYSPDGTALAIGRYDGLVQLWDVAARRERFRSRAHGGRVFAMAFAPDGRTLATASEEHFLVRIWDVAAGRERRTLTYSEEGHYRGSLAVSPDGNDLAFGATLRKTGEPVLCIWDLRDDAGPVVIRKPHDSLNWGLAFAPGDRLITSGDAVADVRDAGGRNGRQVSTPQIRAWDARSGRRLGEFGLGRIPSPSWLTLSRDGKTLVTSHDDRLLVWDLASERIVRTIPVDDAWCGAISPDGRTLAGGRANRVGLWDAATGRPLFGPDGAHDFAVSAAIGPAGRLAATIDPAGTVRVWDPARSQVVRTLDLGRRIPFGWGGTFTVRFSPDGRYLAAGGEDHKAETSRRIAVVRFWDLQGFRLLLDEERTDRDATLLEFSPDGRRAAVVFSKRESLLPRRKGKTLEPGDDDVIELFDVGTGKTTRTLRGHGRAIKGMAFAPDGRGLVSAGEDGNVRFWDIASGAMTRVIPIEGHRTGPQMDPPGAPAEIAAVAFSADLATAVTAGAFDDRLLAWDLKAGRPRRTFSVPAYHSGVLALSPDGRLLAAALQPIRGAKIRVEAPEPTMEILDAEIVVWDIATKRERLRLDPGVRGVESLAFAADGRTLISGMSDTTALIWDVSAACDAPGRPQERRGSRSSRARPEPARFDPK